MNTDRIRYQQSIAQIQSQQKTTQQPVKIPQQQSFEQVLNRIEQKQTVSFSKHAQNRLKERGIEVNLQKLGEAVDKADAKGIKDSLVLMDQSAFIVHVPGRVVITAMNRDEIMNNVFTNIDGAVIS